MKDFGWPFRKRIIDSVPRTSNEAKLTAAKAFLGTRWTHHPHFAPTERIAKFWSDIHANRNRHPSPSSL